MDILPQYTTKFNFLFNDEENRPYYWVAGGAILSALTNEPINDYDIFSNDSAKVIQYFDSKQYKKTFENDRIVNYIIDNKKVQIITAYQFLDMKSCIDNFDFTIICAAYDGKKLEIHNNFYLDVAQKRLVINKLNFPLSSMQRAFKYTRRGYFLCPVGMSTLLKEIVNSNIDWENPKDNTVEFYPDGTRKFVGYD